MKKLYIFLLSFVCMHNIDASSDFAFGIKLVPATVALQRLQEARVLSGAPLKKQQEWAQFIGQEALDVLAENLSYFDFRENNLTPQEIEVFNRTIKITCESLKQPRAQKAFAAIHQDEGQAYQAACAGVGRLQNYVDFGKRKIASQVKILSGFPGERDDVHLSEYKVALFPEPSSRVAQPSKKLPSLPAQIARL